MPRKIAVITESMKKVDIAIRELQDSWSIYLAAREKHAQAKEHYDVVVSDLHDSDEAMNRSRAEAREAEAAFITAKDTFKNAHKRYKCHIRRLMQNKQL